MINDKYTRDEKQIYFLNDKNIISSLDDETVKINPIPSQQIAVELCSKIYDLSSDLKNLDYDDSIQGQTGLIISSLSQTDGKISYTTRQLMSSDVSCLSEYVQNEIKLSVENIDYDDSIKGQTGLVLSSLSQKDGKIEYTTRQLMSSDVSCLSEYVQNEIKLSVENIDYDDTIKGQTGLVLSSLSQKDGKIEYTTRQLMSSDVSCLSEYVQNEIKLSVEDLDYSTKLSGQTGLIISSLLQKDGKIEYETRQLMSSDVSCLSEYVQNEIKLSVENIDYDDSIKGQTGLVLSSLSQKDGKIEYTTRQLSTQDVFGLDDKIEKMSNVSCFVVSSENVISSFDVGGLSIELSTLRGGTVAIVSSYMIDQVDEKYVSRRALFWNKDGKGDNLGHWEAFDGNYGANQVYLTSDMRITYALGKYQISSCGYSDIGCKGKNIQEFLKEAYANKSEPSVGLPEYTFTVNGSLNQKEVGDTYRIPSSTFTFKSLGSYQYNNPPTNTGVRILANTVTISCATGTFQNTKDLSVVNSTLTSEGGLSDIKFTDSIVTYYYNLSAHHTSGYVPVDNLGDDCPTKAISADVWGGSNKDVTKTINAQFKGYRNSFFGSSVEKTSADQWSSDDLRKLNKQSASNYTYPSGQFNVIEGARQIVIAVLSSMSKEPKTKIIQSGVENPITFEKYKDEYGKDKYVYVEGCNGYESKAYVLWYKDAAGVGSGVQIKFNSWE